MNVRGSARTVALAVVVALAVSVAVASAATVRVGSETVVCGVAEMQAAPAIHGDIVVWNDNRDFTPNDVDIYMRNLSAVGNLPVHAGLEYQADPKIFGDIIVWEDQRNAATSDSDIYMRDLSTGTESAVCAVTGIQGSPDVFGDLVVWEDSRTYATTGADIYLKDVSMGVQAVVCNAGADQTHPVISGDIVVWVDYRDLATTGRDLYMKNLATGVISPVCTANGTQMNPDISGDIVVWEDDRNQSTSGWDIYMKNLSTGIESLVCAAADRQLDPVVFGDLVMWTDWRNPDLDVYMKDLSTGVETLVANGFSGQWEPALYSHVAVWADNRTMDQDIYSARIDGPPTRLIALEGVTRYETAAAASRDAYSTKVPVDIEGYRTVVIATGRNFPDALGAAGLAGVLDAPVLITDTNTLPASLAAEIARLGATRAIIVGGEDVVGPAVSTQLGYYGITTIERVEGRTRYDTADALARRSVLTQGAHYGNICFVATGRNFPDALAAAPIAAAHGWPIFLAGPSGLSASTLQAMTDINVTEAHILGGPDVVSSQVEQLLRTRLGTAHVVRHFGDTRYETAVSVARFGVDGAGMQWDGLAIATGENFPDALCGGALQARGWSVLLLTKGGSLPSAVGSRLSTERDYITRVKFLGGTDVVSPAVRSTVGSLLH